MVQCRAAAGGCARGAAMLEGLAKEFEVRRCASMLAGCGTAGLPRVGRRRSPPTDTHPTPSFLRSAGLSDCQRRVRRDRGRRGRQPVRGRVGWAVGGGGGSWRVTCRAQPAPALSTHTLSPLLPPGKPGTRRAPGSGRPTGLYRPRATARTRRWHAAVGLVVGGRAGGPAPALPFPIPVFSHTLVGRGRAQGGGARGGPPRCPDAPRPPPPPHVPHPRLADAPPQVAVARGHDVALVLRHGCRVGYRVSSAQGSTAGVRVNVRPRARFEGRREPPTFQTPPPIPPAPPTHPAPPAPASCLLDALAQAVVGVRPRVGAGQALQARVLGDLGARGGRVGGRGRVGGEGGEGRAAPPARPPRHVPHAPPPPPPRPP